MIIVYQGESLTSTATEDEVMFMEIGDNGRPRPTGRIEVMFEMVSGTIQCAVGKSVNTSKATSHTTTAQPRSILTIANQSYPANEPQEGGPRNLRVVGVGVCDCNW